MQHMLVMFNNFFLGLSKRDFISCLVLTWLVYSTLQQSNSSVCSFSTFFLASKRDLDALLLAWRGHPSTNFILWSNTANQLEEAKILFSSSFAPSISSLSLSTLDLPQKIYVSFHLNHPREEGNVPGAGHDHPLPSTAHANMLCSFAPLASNQKLKYKPHASLFSRAQSS